MRTRCTRVSAASIAVISALFLTCLVSPTGSAFSAELRKRPPQDTKPAAVVAQALAQERYPQLFDRHFDGSVVIAVVFERGGAARLINLHTYAQGTPAADFDMAAENEALGIDSEEDVAYHGGEYPDFTIGPWIDYRNPGRLFVVYEVLKWHPDPSRTRARVQAAVEAYDPTLLATPPPGTQPRPTQLTVFMNDDGTVNRLLRRDLGMNGSFKDDAVERFASMGISKEQLGRRGFAASVTKPLARGPLLIDYAWPRRPDDPADVAELNTAWRAVFDEYRPHEDSDDDAAIAARYFPDIQRQGSQAVTEVINSQRFRLTPWILFGRDGRIWDSGRWHNESELSMAIGTALFDELQARYPGTRVSTGGTWSTWVVNGVPIECLWISADSPLQQKSQVNLRSRKDLLVTGAFLYSRASGASDPPARMTPPIPFASALDFGVPTHLRPGPLSVQLTVSGNDATTATVLVSVQEPQTSLDPKTTAEVPARSFTIRIPYGASATLDLPDSHRAQAMQLVLRPQLL